jgi:hypothetical protein
VLFVKSCAVFPNNFILYDSNFRADEIITGDRSPRDNVTRDVRCGVWDYNVKGSSPLAYKE